MDNVKLEKGWWCSFFDRKSVLAIYKICKTI